MRSSTISCCFFDIVINNFNQRADPKALNRLRLDDARRLEEGDGLMRFGMRGLGFLLVGLLWEIARKH